MPITISLCRVPLAPPVPQPPASPADRLGAAIDMQSNAQLKTDRIPAEAGG